MTRRLRLQALAEAIGAEAYGGTAHVPLPTDAPRWFGDDAPIRRHTPDDPAPAAAVLRIVADASAAPPHGAWLALAQDDDILAWRLRRALDRLLDGTGIPGTAVRIGTHGVVLTGASGIGKSHVALELLRRGHALVADDLVCLESAGGQLAARAPEHGRGRLALRGPGVIDVTEHFGAEALARSAPPWLLVHLTPHTPGGDALVGDWRPGGLLGHAIPRLDLQPGPMIATVIEVALRERLRHRGGRGSAPAWIREQREALRCG